jgi:lysyl-tRNA synthetase class 2
MRPDLDVLLWDRQNTQGHCAAEMGPGAVVEGLYAQLVEPMRMPPNFYTDVPVETSPLTHRRRSTPPFVRPEPKAGGARGVCAPWR